MNSGRNFKYNNSYSNSNYNDSGSGLDYSSIPYFMMSQNSNMSGGGGGDSSNYNRTQYNYSRNTSQSTNSYSSSSYGYGGGSLNQGSFQYSATVSSDMNSSLPFSYADNGSDNKRKNRGQQPWVNRDSLKRPGPYAGARGMNLMQKMGWNPGQGLGRRENGELEPQFPDIKMDKRGLDAGKKLSVPVSVKAKGGHKLQMATIKLITEGKNPLSILEEYCSKRKLEAPKYAAVVDEGPVHAKNYVFKVTVDGVDYTAEKGSNVKKSARLEAAKKCLKDLGVLTQE